MFHNTNSDLIITPEHKLVEWKNILLNQLNKNNELFFIFDTETTGLNPYGESKDNFIKDRIIELGIIPMIRNKKNNETYIPKDSDGEYLFFHEYVNFLEEDENALVRYNSRTHIPKEVVMITGITEKTLSGKENLPGLDYTLPKSAPTFAKIFRYLSEFLLLEEVSKYYNQIYGVAHNAPFDYGFLNAEMEKMGYSPFEAYIKKIDTVTLAKQCISSEDFEKFNQNTEEKINKMKNTIKQKIQLGDTGAYERLKSDCNKLLSTLTKNVEEMEMQARGTSKRTGNSKQALQTRLKDDIEKINFNEKSNIQNNIDHYVDKIYDGISLVTKVKNYTLNDLQKFFNIKTERELHGALLDTQILVNVFENIISLDSYKNAPNMPPQHNQTAIDFINQKQKRTFDPNRKKIKSIKI